MELTRAERLLILGVIGMIAYRLQTGEWPISVEVEE
jgi:hypothetical protein